MSGIEVRRRGASGTSDPFGFGLIHTVELVADSSTVSLGAPNRSVYLRVIGGGPVSKIGLEVGVASGQISVAAYRNAGAGRDAAPRGGLLATSGAIPCPATGYAEVSLGSSIDVQPGDWFALSNDDGNATFRAVGTPQTVSDLYKGRSYYQSAAHPAPAVPTPIAALVRGFVMVGVS